jgi:hypothetical protein
MKFFLSGFLLGFKDVLHLQQISAFLLFLVLHRGQIIVDTMAPPSILYKLMYQFSL